MPDSTGDQHTHAQMFHERRRMEGHGRRSGAEVGAQHVDDKGRRPGRVANIGICARSHMASEGSGTLAKIRRPPAPVAPEAFRDARDPAAVVSLCWHRWMVGDFALAEHLHAVGRWM